MGSGWSNYSANPTPGRASNRPSTSSRDRHNLPYRYPNSWRFTTYENSNDDPPAEQPDEPVDKPEDKPAAAVATKASLKVKAVNFNIKENAVKHHTDEYDITDADAVTAADGSKIVPQLVVRRGEVFQVTLTLDRLYDKEHDMLTIIFEIGPEPKESKKTLVYLDLDGKGDNWESDVKESSGNDLIVNIKASADCAIGKWSFLAHTSIKQASSDGRREVHRYIHSEPVYILFNPWCKEDTVYMEDDVMRDECVLNDNGLLYTGSHYQIGSRPWNFGQFNGNILDCCMYLLDISRLNYQVRGDPIHVSRCISAIVNAPNDRGVLVGNWSGDYSGGTRPTAWLGSADILEQYYKTKEPVMFGQCWVFSGIVTTVSRALGLPARSVTNFSSAHDTDGSITIDKHVDHLGKPAKQMDSDSVWNFHVWNEGWMARRDLPSGYGGWQAFDATPQETSGGIYQAGPASVKSIKEGTVNNRYDAQFIFAEVNADKVHWKQQEQHGRFNKVIKVEKHSVGKNISTHRPRNNPRPESWFANMYRMSIDDFRDDLTGDYKYKENSEEERAVVYRANLHSTRPGEIYGDTIGIQDVKFQLKQKDNILVGSVFNVTLEMQNTSRLERNVYAEVEIYPVYYTGVVTSDSRPIKEQRFNIQIPPVKTKEAVMRVSVDDYIHKIVEQVTFEISVYARVEETEQEHPIRELYRLRRPDLIITAPDSAKAGETIKVKVKLESPMPVHLTECEWDIQGAHVTEQLKIKQADIDPFGHVEIEVDITPRKPGHREIMASFTSKELQDITFSIPILITE